MLTKFHFFAIMIPFFAVAQCCAALYKVTYNFVFRLPMLDNSIQDWSRVYPQLGLLEQCSVIC